LIRRSTKHATSAWALRRGAFWSFWLAGWLAATSLLTAPPVEARDAEPRCTRIEMFSREDCPHCAEAKLFLGQLAHERPDLEIIVRDVELDPGARTQLLELSRVHAVAPGVPAFAICDDFVVGFVNEETTGQNIAGLLGRFSQAAPGAASGRIVVPLFGALDVDALGLPAFTLLLGFVDGLNPCAMWVLLFLLSILVNVRDRRRIVAIAGTFVLVSGLAYFAFMAAWLNVFLWIGLSRAVQVALGFVAAGVGAMNVKDFFAFGAGPSLSIPEAAKPGIHARVRRIVQAENFGAALAGAFLLAVLVNFIELLCTAGLPAIYTQILTLQDLPRSQYYGYLLLYNCAYILDDAALVTLVVVTLGRRKLQEEQGRWLKLLSGSVMLALGILLLLRPDWLAW
jgi:glutaredoxin